MAQLTVKITAGANRDEGMWAGKLLRKIFLFWINSRKVLGYDIVRNILVYPIFQEDCENLLNL